MIDLYVHAYDLPKMVGENVFAGVNSGSLFKIRNSITKSFLSYYLIPKLSNFLGSINI